MRQAKPARVLIVDDEPDVRAVLSDALRGQGFEIHSAGDAAEALAVAEDLSPDLLVADLNLPDRSGLEVLDRLREDAEDLPAVFITGLTDSYLAREAAGRGCVDFLTKPLDLPRLRRSVRRGLSTPLRLRRLEERVGRYRSLVRAVNLQRREVRRRLNTSCAGLTTAYRTLNRQLRRQEALIRFQKYLLGCRGEDDVFRGLFRFFAERSGGLFGLAMVCDDKAELRLVGRFGTPAPDGVTTCEQIATALTPLLLEDPRVTRLDGAHHSHLFDPALRGSLPGMTFLCMPLLPTAGQLIGLTILYRKGEQPFTEDDLAMAEIIAPCVALRVQCGAANE